MGVDCGCGGVWGFYLPPEHPILQKLAEARDPDPGDGRTFATDPDAIADAIVALVKAEFPDITWPEGTYIQYISDEPPARQQVQQFSLLVGVGMYTKPWKWPRSPSYKAFFEKADLYTWVWMG